MNERKLKGVIDTPTLIAAALYKGICRSILVDALNHHQVFISEDLISDFLTTVDAPTYEKKRSYLHTFIRGYTSCARVVQTVPGEKGVLPPLYDALIQKVQPDFLVSCILENLSLKKVEKTIVLSPQDFSKILQSKS